MLLAESNVRSRLPDHGPPHGVSAQESFDTPFLVRTHGHREGFERDYSILCGDAAEEDF